MVVEQKPCALVTGISGGIGSALAQRLFQKGWDVVGVDRRPPAFSSDLKAFFECDIDQGQTWEPLILDLQKEAPELGALVNLAAIQICKPIKEFSLLEIEQTFRINSIFPAYFSSRLHSNLKAGKGAVLHVSSVHAQATSAEMSYYAASKAALSSIARSQAQEWAKDGLRVNALLPGAVDTAMLKDSLHRGGSFEQNLKQLESAIPLGRAAKPSEIAAIIEFLLSSDASYVSGAAWTVDGGVLSRLASE